MVQHRTVYFFDTPVAPKASVLAAQVNVGYVEIRRTDGAE